MEFLAGDEYVVDTMSRDGVHKCVCIWKYIKFPLNGTPRHAASFLTLALSRTSRTGLSP